LKKLSAVDNKIFVFNRPWFTTISRLETKQKDPETLIKAFSEYLKDYKVGTLLFIGEGPDKSKLIKLVEDLGIGSNVKFLGFMKNPFKILSNSDLFVLSSKSEGFGMVLAEAQCLGIPIIATDCPAGPRWILDGGKAGILVKVGDVYGMQKAMRKIIASKRLSERLTTNGLALSDRFNYDIIKRNWIKFLNSI
jgi:glycosyltransferase involved in cell wall biosynthesis